MTGRKKRSNSLGSKSSKNRIGLVLLLYSVVVVGTTLVPLLGTAQQAGLGPGSTFVFAAAGDWSNSWGSSGVTERVVTGIAGSGADFAIGLGDLAYASGIGVSQSWCQNFKGIFNNIVLIAGNHESGETGFDPMEDYVPACPFSVLGVPMVSGTIVDSHGSGYGYEYAFDYPATNPIARFILIVPSVNWGCCGLSGTYSYDVGTANYDWVSARIDEARAAGEWVIVGFHKNGLSSGGGFSIGTDIWNLMFEKTVDLVIVGHEHVSERTYQLSCGEDVASCIANNSPGTYRRGDGVEYVIQGTGGRGFTGVGPSTVFVPGSQNDVEHGFMKYTVSATSLSGQFVSVEGSFTDSFAITSGPSTSPSVSFTFSPSSPVAGETVTFTASATGTPPYTYSWSFGDGITGSGQTILHSYSGAGTYTARLDVTDSSANTGSTMRTVSVAVPPTPDFTVAANPAILWVQAGNSDVSHVQLVSVDGFSGSVSLSATMSPPEPSIGASLDVASVSLGPGGSASSTMTVSTSSSTPEGTYDILVSATGGSVQHTAHISVTVSLAPPPPDFAMTAAPSSLTIVGGQSGFSTITLVSVNEFIGTVSVSAGSDPVLAVLLSRTSVALSAGTFQTITVTITVLSGTNEGTYAVWVDASSGPLAHSLGLTVHVSIPFANRAPVLTVPGRQTATVGSLLHFTVTVSDPDAGQLVVLSASGLPPGASFDASTGEFSWVSGSGDVGTYVMIFLAVDDGSPRLSDSESVTIDAVAASPPPAEPPTQQPPSFWSCPWCQSMVPRGTNLWLLALGGIVGIIIPLGVMYARAQSSLRRARRRFVRDY